MFKFLNLIIMFMAIIFSFDIVNYLYFYYHMSMYGCDAAVMVYMSAKEV